MFSLPSRKEGKKPTTLKVAIGMLLVGGVKSCIMVTPAASGSWWRRFWSQRQGTRGLSWGYPVPQPL